ncbi:MAG TPA: ABC transporter substrate-binding protein [Chloroflexota bacterium]|jgi:peptide/nickel transport system substrate-binding protein
MALRTEVNVLMPKIPGSTNPSITTRIFNAEIAIIGGKGEPRAYLVEALPQLNTDDWRVFADGRMQVTYRLRPNLTWHDGHPLTSSDFVFGYRVYTAPGPAIFAPTPQNLMESVEAPDPRTVVIHWSGPYADAAVLIEGDFEPLPQHLLESSFSAVEHDVAARDPFIQLPFWSSEYVGAGPYRLVHWEPGTSFDAVAFEGHALGRPKIDQLHMRLFGDENTVLTNLLSGDMDYGPWLTMRIEHAITLRREWDPTGQGLVYFRQGGPSIVTNQLRPEYADPAAILDVRVRRALAHGIDRDAINEGVFSGAGFPSDSYVPAGLSHYDAVQRVMSHYPYDVRQAESLMAEAGFTKDREGLFARGTDRLRFEMKASAGVENERLLQIQAQDWNRAGFEVSTFLVPLAQSRDLEGRHTFRSMQTRGGLNAGERSWTSAEIGTAQNRWRGENRTGWSNPEYDRLFEAFLNTLDRGQREQQVVQMHRVLSEQLPAFQTHFSAQVMAHVSALQGPEPGLANAGVFSPETAPHWNIHEWTWR